MTNHSPLYILNTPNHVPMHILVLNQNPLQASFIQRGFRHESIGADRCDIENLTKIWYGQYDALVIPVDTWTPESFKELQIKRQTLGNIPTIFTSKFPPPLKISLMIDEDPSIEFIANQKSFHLLSDSTKRLTRDNAQRISAQETTYIEIGDIKMDITRRHVQRQNRPIKLRNREFILLVCLMKNVNKVLTRTYLLEEVWDRNTSILSNTVDVHVSRLRRKIDDGFETKRILTIPCVGYKLSE